MYGAAARFYDRLYEDGRDGPLRDGMAEANRVVAEIQAAGVAGATLLDVACGTGRFLRYLPDTMSVAGLDLNTDLLAIARSELPSATFHETDMTTFELDTSFDVITCLFSSIAYAGTYDRMRLVLERMAAHLTPGGLVVIEPWFTPELFWDGHLSSNHLDQPDLKITWMYRQERHGSRSILPIHYLIATPNGVQHLEERHELGLFTHEEYVSAMSDVGLRVRHDPDGFGRGLYVGIDARP